MAYGDLVEDGHIPGLLVHPDWYEPRHPQETPVDASDSEALWHPAPELSEDGGTAIALLTATWSPAPVDETVDSGLLTATTYTLTAAGGYAGYSYQFNLLGGSGQVAIEAQSANTLKLRVGISAGTYPVIVVGTVTDTLGQQTSAAFSVSLVLNVPLPLTLDAYIAALLPTHWWKLQNTGAPTTLTDAGSGPAITPVDTGTHMTQRGGPDNFSRSIFFDQFLNGFEAAANPGTASSGSVCFLFRNNPQILISTTIGPALLFEDVTGNRQITIGFAGYDGASTGRLSVGFYGVPTNWRQVYDTTGLFPGDNNWHVCAFTFDGVGTPKIYLDSVQRTTTSNTLGGSAPPINTWLGDGFVRNRVNVGGGVAFNDEIAGFLAHVFMIDNVIMSTAQMADMVALVNNGTYTAAITALTPYRNFLLDEASGPSTDTGSAGVSATDVSFPSRNNTGAELNGGTGDKAITFNGVTTALALNGTPGTATTGSIALVAKISSANPAAAKWFLDFVQTVAQEPTNPGRLSLRMTSAGVLELFISKTGVSGSRTRTFTGTNVKDNIVHSFIVTQRGDGTGPHVFIDGVELTTFSDATAGTVPGLNSWWDTLGSGLNNGLAYEARALTPFTNMKAYQVTTFDTTILSDAQVLALHSRICATTY
jgi:hypothetical protein